MIRPPSAAPSTPRSRSWAMPATGARAGRPVVAGGGGGGFLFSVAGLAAGVKCRLAIVFLVVNGDRSGAIKGLQEKLFAGRGGEAGLANPDFPALARAFGARGERLASVDALPAALDAAFKAGGPTLFELNVTVEPPWELK